MVAIHTLALATMMTQQFTYMIMYNTLMASKTKKKQTSQELDSIYILKLVVYLVLGSLWLKITDGQDTQIPIPIGFFIGLVFASHDHIQLDRKIGYAVLLVAMLIGFWAPFGVYVAT